MEEFNPYQSPQADLIQPLPDEGIWRRGAQLVLHKDTLLPDICLKTALPADRRIALRCKSPHGIRPKHFTIELPVSDTWWLPHRRRKQLEMVAGLFTLVFVVIGAVGGEMKWDLLLVFAMFGGSIYLGGFIIYLFVRSWLWSTSFVEPAKVGEHHLFLRGVSDAVLDQYPDWPVK